MSNITCTFNFDSSIAAIEVDNSGTYEWSPDLETAADQEQVFGGDVVSFMLEDSAEQASMEMTHATLDFSFAASPSIGAPDTPFVGYSSPISIQSLAQVSGNDHQWRFPTDFTVSNSIPNETQYRFTIWFYGKIGQQDYRFRIDPQMIVGEGFSVKRTKATGPR